MARKSQQAYDTYVNRRLRDKANGKHYTRIKRKHNDLMQLIIDLGLMSEEEKYALYIYDYPEYCRVLDETCPHCECLQHPVSGE